MKIHEYQAKSVLRSHGVPVPRGEVAHTPPEAREIAQRLGGKVVVKAQIHAGGRGKAGGVKLAGSADEAEEIARKILGMTLITPQTGAEGKKVHRLLVEEGVEVEREFYLSLVVDRATARVAVIASAEGGTEIEEVAAKQPEKILREQVPSGAGFPAYLVRKLTFGLGMGAEHVKPMGKLLAGLFQAFQSTDASMAEINPLVITKGGDVLALDAKMNFDDSALFRHPEILALRDEDEEDPMELEAARHELNYIKLDGSIGCMVNGAGLAMATMDIIKLTGGEPANFLDVGGGATKERVTTAFKIILSDPRVAGILVNIFGGIMRCDVIAEGVVAGAREVSLQVPLVVRLAGTNVELGKKILADSGLPILSADDLADAAEKVVEAVGKAA